jgi:hypothetical protein
MVELEITFAFLFKFEEKNIVLNIFNIVMRLWL